MKIRTYLCIDLKSFYASVECVERGLDPFKTNLVVADPDRSSGTLCLAVSPALKKFGVPGRCRVFEIPNNIKYIMAPPRMQLYINYAANIYAVYLKYISKEDIHVYSIDEAFLDITDYLHMYQMSPKELSIKIINDIRETTGVTATVGIGTNLYLAKIAMDIIAKKSRDFIGELNEESYKKLLWDHRPLKDFWRIGPGIARRLESVGVYTMKDITQINEKVLYKLLGIDAELLIDHAWGIETCTMQDIKEYNPKINSLSSSQVLMRDYKFNEGRLITKEMTDLLCLELVNKKLVTNSITLHVSYNWQYQQKSAHGTAAMTVTTSSAQQIITYISELYNKIVDRQTPIRKIGITFNNVVDETYQQYDLFASPADMDKEHNLQKAIIQIKNKYGKNSILKGMNLLDGGTTRERNRQIGGHKSGV